MELKVFNNYEFFSLEKISAHWPNLENHIFKNRITFHGTFDGKVNFKNCVFEKYVDFSEATFLGEVDFSETVFKQGCSFRGAKFYTNGGDVSFEKAVFLPFITEELRDIDEFNKIPENVSHIDFSDAEFGKKFERIFGEWETWFIQDSQEVFYLKYRHISDQIMKTNVSKKFNDNESLGNAMQGLPLEAHLNGLFRSFDIIKQNPNHANFRQTRFGQLKIDEFDTKDVEKYQDHIKNLKNEVDLYLFYMYEDSLNLFQEWLNNRKFFFKEEQKNSFIISILTKYMYSFAKNDILNFQKLNISFFNIRFYNLGDVDFSYSSFVNNGSLLFHFSRFQNCGKLSYIYCSFINNGDCIFSPMEIASGKDLSFSYSVFANLRSVQFNGCIFNNADDILFKKIIFSNKGSILFEHSIIRNQGIFSFYFSSFLNIESISFPIGKINFIQNLFANQDMVSFLRYQKPYFNYFFDSSNYLFLKSDFVIFKDNIFLSKGISFKFCNFDQTEKFIFKDNIFLCQYNVDFTEVSFPEKSKNLFSSCHFGINKMYFNEDQSTDENIQEVLFDRVNLPQTTFEPGEIGWLKHIADRRDGNLSQGGRKLYVTIDEILKNREIEIESLPPETRAWVDLLHSNDKDRIPINTPIFDEDVVVSWKGLSPESAKNITFRLVNLQRSLFDGKTLTHVQLNAPSWLEGKAGWFSKRKKLYAEELALNEYEKLSFDERKKEENKKPLRDVLDQYTQLKNNLEAQRNFLDAGDFHYGEMEMRRLIGGQGFLLRILTWMYATFTGYGERPARAAAWAVGILIIFPVLTLLSTWYSGTHRPSEFLTSTGIIDLSLRYFRVFLEIITPFSWKENIIKISQTNWHRFLPVIFAQIALYVQLPLFVLALRRRFKR